MKLIIDTREQLPLTFSVCRGTDYVSEALVVGDYSARYVINGKETESIVIIERKSIGDLFSSYTSGYERERAKFLRSKELDKQFILAIEGTISDVLRGHTYTKGGHEHQSKKDGMTMLKQLMTCAVKYDVRLMFCATRAEMAMFVQEYFLAEERWLLKRAEEEREKVSKKC